MSKPADVLNSTALKFEGALCASNGTVNSGLVAATFQVPVVLYCDGTSVGTLGLTNLSNETSSFSSGGIHEIASTGHYILHASTSGATGTYHLFAEGTVGEFIGESITVYGTVNAQTTANALLVGNASTPTNLAALVISSAGLVNVGQNGTGGSTTMTAGTLTLDNATATRNANVVSINGSANSAASLANIWGITGYSGTATAGSANTITLQTALGANARAVGSLLVIVRGTGAGQERIITTYTDSSQQATMRTWDTNPDNTSVYVIVPMQLPANDSGLVVQSIGVGFVGTANFSSLIIQAGTATLNGGMTTQGLTVTNVLSLGSLTLGGGTLAIAGAGSLTVNGTLLITNSTVVAQSIADALKLAPTAGSPAAGSVYADLNTIITSIAGFAFSGAYTRGFHVQDTATNSLQSATVRIQLNTNAEYHVTPASGNFTTSLDAHTYTLTATCAGFVGYTNTLTVTADGAFTIIMTPVTPPVPASPTDCTLYFYTVDQAGAIVTSTNVGWSLANPEDDTVTANGSSNSNAVTALWSLDVRIPATGTTYVKVVTPVKTITAAIPASTTPGSSIKIAGP